MKKILLALLLAAFGLPMAACPGKAPPNLTPAATTAYYAYKGLAEVNIATRTIGDLEKAGTPGFTKPRVATVMIASYTANIEGQKLADLLEEYDKLTDTTAKLSKQQKILQQLALFEKAAHELAGVDFGSSLPATLVKTISLVFDSIAQLKAALAALKAVAITQPFLTSAVALVR